MSLLRQAGRLGERSLLWSTLTFWLEQVFGVAARREGGCHARVVHRIVERDERRRPARDWRRPRRRARRCHGRRDEAERRGADDATDGVDGAEARVGEHLKTEKISGVELGQVDQTTQNEQTRTRTEQTERQTEPVLEELSKCPFMRNVPFASSSLKPLSLDQAPKHKT